MKLNQPATIPPVRPVPEYVAKGELKEVYEDLKKELGVPWVGVITQALAYYEPFFIEAWKQLKPSAQTSLFEDRCNDIRIVSWEGVIDSFQNCDQIPRLKDLGYKEKELTEIRDILDILDYGNPKYLVFATVVKDALINGKINGRKPSDPRGLFPRQPVKTGDRPLLMVEEHHAVGGLTDVYEDIKETLKLPFVNSDYKAQGRWPSYLQVAWNDLKPFIDTQPYNLLRTEINDLAYDLARNLPYSYVLDQEGAAALGMDEEAIDELIEVISLFQYLLSGLIINVSFFKAAVTESGK